MTGRNGGVCRGAGAGVCRRGLGFGQRLGGGRMPSQGVAGAAAVPVAKAATEASSSGAKLERLDRQVQDVSALLQTIAAKLAHWQKDGDNRSQGK